MSTDSPISLDDTVLLLVDSDRLQATEPHACPYLPNRLAAEQGFAIERLGASTYHALMNRGFRRSGQIFYRPVCPDCDACVPIRLPVADFVPTRSQRRAMRRNQDVTTSVGFPQWSAEKQALYEGYLAFQHPNTPQSPDEQGLKDFLYTSSVDTIEITYRDGNGALIAVSLADVSSESLSSVYHYFSPDHRRRSLGVYSVVSEVALARRWKIPYYYLGFWIADTPSMRYKADYYPHELLRDGVWERRERPLAIGE